MLFHALGKEPSFGESCPKMSLLSQESKGDYVIPRLTMHSGSFALLVPERVRAKS